MTTRGTTLCRKASNGEEADGGLGGYTYDRYSTGRYTRLSVITPPRIYACTIDHCDIILNYVPYVCRVVYSPVPPGTVLLIRPCRCQKCLDY